MNLFCNENKAQPSYLSDERGSFNGGELLTLNYECAASCPQKMSVMFYNVLDDIKWILFVIGLVLGPLELLLGYKLFRYTLMIVGRFYSFNFVVVICNQFYGVKLVIKLSIHLCGYFKVLGVFLDIYFGINWHCLWNNRQTYL